MEEIYFSDVSHILWKARWWMLIAMVAALAIALALYLSAPRQYQTSMTLVSANSAGLFQTGAQQSAASMAGQLFGFSAADRGAQVTEQFLQMFTSPLVIKSANQHAALLTHLFPNLWDPIGKQWIRPNSWRSRLGVFLRGTAVSEGSNAPSLVDAKRYISRHLTIDAPRNSTLVHITYIDADAAFGAVLLNTLYHETDELLRNRARSENDEHIAYIQKTLTSVAYSETRQSLTELLTAEISQRININSDAPYAMEILEPPLVDPTPVSPNPRFYFLLASAVGLLCGLVASLVWPKLNGSSRLLNGSQRAASSVGTSGQG